MTVSGERERVVAAAFGPTMVQDKDREKGNVSINQSLPRRVMSLQEHGSVLSKLSFFDTCSSKTCLSVCGFVHTMRTDCKKVCFSQAGTVQLCIDLWMIVCMAFFSSKVRLGTQSSPRFQRGTDNFMASVRKSMCSGLCRG